MEKIVELKDPMHNSKLLSNQIALPFGVSRITKSTTIIDRTPSRGEKPADQVLGLKSPSNPKTPNSRKLDQVKDPTQNLNSPEFYCIKV